MNRYAELIGNLNDYIKSVDNARIDDYNKLNDYIKSVDDARVADFNTLKELIKKLHGL